MRVLSGRKSLVFLLMYFAMSSGRSQFSVFVGAGLKWGGGGGDNTGYLHWRDEFEDDDLDLFLLLCFLLDFLVFFLEKGFFFDGVFFSPFGPFWTQIYRYLN